MKDLKLIDRVVVEINSEEENWDAQNMAQLLRMIADKLDDGKKGDEFISTNPSNGRHTEILWERECREYGGFRILNDKSLIQQFIYGSEPKPTILDVGEFSVASINRQDLRDFGYDPSKLTDDDMEAIASKMGKAYHEGYCECWGEDLRSAANHYEVPRKEEDDEQA